MDIKPKKPIFKYAIPIIRIIIGMAFLLSGIFKIVDLKGFQKTIEAMGLLGGPLPQLASIFIPVLEIILGLMLLMGIYIRITAIHLNVLVVIFSWVTFYVLRNIPDMLCGCFGRFIDMTFSGYHFIVLFIILVLNLIIIIEPNDTWTLQKLFREKIPTAKKMLVVEITTYVLIALGIILIGFAIYSNVWGKRTEERTEELEDMTLVVEDEGSSESLSGSTMDPEEQTSGDNIQQEESTDMAGQAEIIDISVDEAYEAYFSNKNYIFIDVRSEDEYASGHIKGALHIPVSQIEDHIMDLPKDRPIVLYCNGSSCNRSGAAARVLVANGFMMVYDLTGKGIDEWISKGYPSE